ncbi:MAG: septal ring lytic transglycosylase RlpA family protein [Rhodothermales bacterium]|nr:septal ring lytic transglycosylase RlpA family protein [Rhodothermales bacterium]
MVTGEGETHRHNPFVMSRTLTLFALIVLTAVPALAQDVEVGYASWYNRGFHGLTTASGEAYDHEALTAAHPTLPFGTLIRVTRTDDGRSIQVRVNDRMVSGPGHVIDLSGAAARDLGLLETGVARVRIGDTVSSAVPTAVTTPVSVTSTPATGAYTLQLGVFSSRESAQQLAARHDGAWIQSVTNYAGASAYRVYYRSFDAEPSARTAQRSLTDQGVESFLRSLR